MKMLDAEDYRVRDQKLREDWWRNEVISSYERNKKNREEITKKDSEENSGFVFYLILTLFVIMLLFKGYHNFFAWLSSFFG